MAPASRRAKADLDGDTLDSPLLILGSDDGEEEAPAAELDLVLAGFKDCVLDARPRLSVAELGEFMPKGSEVLKARRAKFGTAL